ncbi:NAD-dependent succinate-semialdehyde dehydrogenase [Naumannella halotolerans]|uniref:Succinate-semialdehyde dehydrogenase/glutarate-semialdehyde dehydrogenase n=1 Tax=Naumannella halotolerans TaxID=993414 RepID=A0A4V3EMP6_9ACTN|nr:NAD-dependent succinate-semialdehyde dehydrogenase [Naumannella halotolerans]TDT30908.1 succinate-semialdehyde dehydrogenase/glutarate-semialdehyde dehydrogenase [Naumannella halotolerans]
MSEYQVQNPATGEVVEEFPTATDEQIRDALERSHKAYLSWRDTPVEERTAVLRRVAEIYTERAEELAGIIGLEMGKAVPEGVAEVKICNRIYNYFADNAAAFIEDELLRGPAGDDQAYLLRKPVGSLLGIMPWNFPYYQVARFAAPNLALGNTIILKHAPQCPRSAAMMEQIFVDAGLPADAYINVYATNDQVSEVILPSPLNQGVSLTGSERAGSAVAAAAGKNLKKVVLELGGSDPFVVLDTDDIDATVETMFGTRMGNNGQACNSPKRMIIMDDIYDEVATKIAEKAKALIPADPYADPGKLSPLSSISAAERFVGQVEETVKDGATVLAGGERIEGPGAYVQPVVLTDVKKGNAGYYDELFGPAFMLFRVADDDEAVTLANDTPFGLGSAVFATDRGRAEKVADRLEAGMVYINTPEASREFLPFGGVKRSGIGRELGPLAMDEFCNKQMVYKKA